HRVPSLAVARDGRASRHAVSRGRAAGGSVLGGSQCDHGAAHWNPVRRGKGVTVTQAGSSPEITLTRCTILIRDQGDDPSKRKLSLVSKDPNLKAAAPGSSSDPTLVGATLHFVNPRTGESDAFMSDGGGAATRGDLALVLVCAAVAQTLE